MPSRSGQLAQSIISRRMRRTREIDKAPATEQPSSSAAPLIFESSGAPSASGRRSAGHFRGLRVQ